MCIDAFKNEIIWVSLMEDTTNRVLTAWQLYSHHGSRATLLNVFPSAEDDYQQLSIGNYVMRGLAPLPFLVVTGPPDYFTKCIAPARLPEWVANTANLLPSPLTMQPTVLNVQREKNFLENQKRWGLHAVTIDPRSNKHRDTVKDFHQRVRQQNGGHLINAQPDGMMLLNGQDRMHGKLEWSQGNGTSATAHLNGFMVSSEIRGLGGGKLLLKAVEQAARNKGMKLVHATPWEGSEGFYKKMRYEWSTKIIDRPDTYRVVPSDYVTNKDDLEKLRARGAASFTDEEARGNPEITLVLLNGQRTAGYACGGRDPYDSRFWRLNEVFTDMDGVGGGRHLLRQAEEVARSIGCRYMLALTHGRSAFVRAMGYQNLCIGQLAFRDLGLKRKAPTI